MSRTVKLLIGLVAALLAAWLVHGPLGTGEAFVAGMESEARVTVAATEVRGIGVSFPRAPLSRTAILSGDANDFQRNGMGEQPGLTGLIGLVPGVEKVRWADESGSDALPLLAEVLAAAAVAYAIGILIGWLMFGRPRRESYLS